MDPLTLLLVALGVWVFFQASGNGGAGADIGTQDSGMPMSPGTGKLSVQTIAQLAATAGFQGGDLLTAVAIALAESGGDPSVVGDLSITPGGSVGLWQINLRWHPEYTAAMLVDPQTNANAAFKIYQAAHNSFSPWTTFNTGAYMSYLDQASAYLSA